jgi:hypothetical protein
VSTAEYLVEDLADSTVEDSRSRVEQLGEITNMMHYALPICTLQTVSSSIAEPDSLTMSFTDVRSLIPNIPSMTAHWRARASAGAAPFSLPPSSPLRGSQQPHQPKGD